MRYALLTCALLSPLSVAVAQKKAHDGKSTHAAAASVTTPDAITWTAASAMLPPGAKVAALEGDPAKHEAFTVRLNMPDGYQIAPHTHPAVEHVTIMSGSLMIGMGNKFDESSMKTLPSGTFGVIPVGMAHYVKAKGETVLQLHGVGPWRVVYVNKADDPRNKKVAAK
ncbi:MAG: cupin domain-containing protein [Gemmatimonadaceae bacterium]